MNDAIASTSASATAATAATDPGESAGATAALVNCTPPDGVDLALSAASAAQVPYGAYAHLGAVDPAVPWGNAPELIPEQYADRAARWMDRGATIVGGCCGTTPAHIAALAARLRIASPK